MRHGTRLFAMLAMMLFGLGCGSSELPRDSAAAETAPEKEAGPSEEEQAELQRVQGLIADGKDLDAQDDETKLTPLFAAADKGHAHVVKLLLEKGAKPNAAAGHGFTPLHIAAQRGHVRIVRMLLGHGAEADRAGGEDQRTPLHQAASGGSLEIVKLLLERKADPLRKAKGGATLVHMAAYGGNVEAVKLALSLGLAANTADNQGWTPLHDAAYADRPEVIELLLQHGAPLESKKPERTDAAARRCPGRTARIPVARYSGAGKATRHPGPA